MSTHLRERRDAKGDVTDYYFFCTRSCYLGSFERDRIGPAGERVVGSVSTGGAAPCAASEPGEHGEIHCAECGGLIASPYRTPPLLVGGLNRPPMGANGEAEPTNFFDGPMPESAQIEHHVGAWYYHGGTLDEPITYRLDCWWNGRTDGPRAVVGYTLRMNNTVIFCGEDYKPAPSYGPDSTGAAADLIGFLSCKPGDTDAEFFANYTREQLAFAEQHGEELSLWGNELEEEAASE